jgi:uncharacterized protein (TIGR03118 family)
MRSTTRSWKGAARLFSFVAGAGAVAGTYGVACSSSSSDPPGTADGGDAGVVLQRVNETVIIADTADAGAQHVDPDLVNAWGLAFSTNGVAWISDNGTGKATLFPPNADGGLIPSIVVPPPQPSGGLIGTELEAGALDGGVLDGAVAAALDGGVATSSPTGLVMNTSGSTFFMGDVFLISTEDGTIAGWQPTRPAAAQTRIDASANDAVYKGLAIVPTNPPRLLAANFRAGTVDMFDANYAPLAASAVDGGALHPFVDTSVPPGYAPFNVVTIGKNVYVSYALQDEQKHDDVPGLGRGAISVYDFQGNLVKSLVPVGTDGGVGALDAPWGMAIAPSGWGSLGGMLLVGNFGSGTVEAFSTTTGALRGILQSATTNAPLVIDGLWSIVFGNDADAGISPNSLYFTAGPNSEKNGRYGVLTLAQ